MVQVLKVGWEACKAGLGIAHVSVITINVHS